MNTTTGRTSKPFTDLLARSVEAANAARMNGGDRRKVDRIRQDVVRRLQEGDYSVLAPVHDDNEPLGI